jgi:hypothetical protein
MKTCLLFLAFLSAVAIAHAQQSFEGRIKFKADISTAADASKASQEKVMQRYGDSLIVTYSRKGNYKRQYLNTGESGNDSQAYIASTGMLYSIRKNSERIDSLSMAKNGLQLVTKTKMDPQQIIGLNCDCYQYAAKDKVGGDVFITYCSSAQSPAVDPELFGKHENFFLSDFIATSKRPFLKYSMRTGSLNITYTATEMTEMPVADSIFKLTPTTKK